MAVVLVRSAILSGLDVQRIGVEVDVRRGLPNFTIVGLAQDAVRESRDRVIAAVKNSGFEMPAVRVTVNLTPVTMKKASSLLDLPIAVGLLTASAQIPPPPVDSVFLGELSLDGSLRPASGILALLDGLRDASTVILPSANLEDASFFRSILKKGACVRGLATLSELSAPVDNLALPRAGRLRRTKGVPRSGPDFSDVRSNHLARRAAEISAAGGHHLLMMGPPGTGKSMLAHRLPSILPCLSPQESLEVSKIYGVAGMLPDSEWVRDRPFRSPHHTLSDVALIGGGPQGLPGEISLAHRGVLFLDEFPEFPRSCLESLRQPLEDRRVQISRAATKVSYPADFILVCALNPCPCGYARHPRRACRCTMADIRRYFNKLSGPILNRIDLQVELPPEAPDLVLSGPAGESSADILRRVLSARAIQRRRYGTDLRTNAHISGSDLRKFCPLSPECATVLQGALRKMNLSPRSLEKIIKVSRTIADLAAGEPEILPDHVLESIRFRSMDLLTSEAV